MLHVTTHTHTVDTAVCYIYIGIYIETFLDE